MFSADASPESLRNRRNVAFAVVATVILVTLVLAAYLAWMRLKIVQELNESADAILKLNQEYKISPLKDPKEGGRIIRARDYSAPKGAPPVLEKATDEALQKWLAGCWKSKTSPWKPGTHGDLNLFPDGTFDATAYGKKIDDSLIVEGKWTVKDRRLLLTPTDKKFASQAVEIRRLDAKTYSAYDPAIKAEVQAERIVITIEGVLAP